MKKIFSRKKNGEFTDILATVVFLFVTAVIWQVFLFNQRAVNVKNDIDGVINQYVLCMEADGYLSDVNQAALTADLAHLGLTNISFSGTDTSASPKIYGERVTLQVSGKLEIPIFVVAWLRLERGTALVNISEKRVSISHGIS